MMRRASLLAGLALVLLGGNAAQAENGPCEGSIKYLMAQYASDPKTQAGFQAAFDGLQPLPPGYTYGGSGANPWLSAGDGAGLMVAVSTFYTQVCALLPQIVGTNDNALDSIQYFSWFYYHNPAAHRLVLGIDPNDPSQPLDSVKNFLIMFNKEYKVYMDSPASTAPVAQWVADPRLEMQDYERSEAGQYKSWNDFFARSLTFDAATGTYPSRPVTFPDRDYVVVSPTDCIMNPLVQMLVKDTGEVTRSVVENPLQPGTVLDVKGIPISVEQLLANAPAELKDKFVGGTGLACVLMPNTYHHFHSPVDGEILYAEIVEAGSQYSSGTFGYYDWPNWVPLSGDVGRPGTDFSQFQTNQRGVIIIKVSYANLPGKTPERLTGYVASIPVGLETVGSVVFDPTVVKGAKVKKGVTRLGNFFFGGSLNIMLFSPIEGMDGAHMVDPSVQTRLGNQIGIFNFPYHPPKTPWATD